MWFITSVDRDDLRDGGAPALCGLHYCHSGKSPQIKIETLVPDFRGRMDRALDILTATPPDVFNHNSENVPAYLPSGIGPVQITTGR